MLPPPNVPANNKQSISYFWMKDRMAIMLTRIIDSLSRRRNELEVVNKSLGTEREEEVIQSHKLYLKEFPRLKNEMTTNKSLSDLNCEDPKTSQYFAPENANVTADNYKWFSVPFQFAEEYFYKRISLFGTHDASCHFASFDPYKLFKEEAFNTYIKEASVIANELILFEKGFREQGYKTDPDEINFNSLRKPIYRLPSEGFSLQINEHLYAFALASICAENCDSSFFLAKPHVTFKECHDHHVAGTDLGGFHILVNKFNGFYEYVVQASDSGNTLNVDFYLNFCGFDLFATLCFSEMLQRTVGSNCTITFYVQPFPKFFLATAADVEWLLQNESDNEFIASSISMFNKRFSKETWKLKNMDQVEETSSVSQPSSDLCIIKGDYHYRRLLGGLCWPSNTTLKEAIRANVYGSPKAIFTARAIKSDLLVDLNNDHTENKYLTKMLTHYDTVNCLDMNFVKLATV